MTENSDKFELKLSENTKALADCQRSKGFVKHFEDQEYLSCMDCAEIIGCKVRQEYVDAVYMSMSKGAVGGFEF